MSDRDLLEIFRLIEGPVAPRPGFKQELAQALGLDEPDDIEAETIMEKIRGLARPRPEFKVRLGGILKEQLQTMSAVPAIAQGPARSRLRSGRFGLSGRSWFASAAALLVISTVASGTAWNSCVRAPSGQQRATDAASSDEGRGSDEPAGAGVDSLEALSRPVTTAKPKPQPSAATRQQSPAAGRDVLGLAFVSKTDGFWHVFTMNEDGTARTQITDGAAHDRQPDWSPDGRRIVFMRVAEESDHYGKIFVMNADGSGLRFLVEGGEPAWSPDGQQVAYTVPGAGSALAAIHVINADGSSDRAITPRTLSTGDPSWSPREDKISFAAFGVAPGEDDPNRSINVYTMRLDGSEVRRLTDFTWACNMTFSPNGERIAFTASSDFSSLHIWTMDVDGGDRKQLISGPGFAAYPHWSPDGARIVFAFDPDGEPQWGFLSKGPAPGAIWVIHADGANLRRISPVGTDDADPTFRPRQR